MKNVKIILYFSIALFFFLITNSMFGTNSDSLEAEKEEYQQDIKLIDSKNKSFKSGLVNNLEEYEVFADEIQEKWKSRNPENYAKLMLEICKPLSSGTFESRRRFDVSREYALSAMNDPNKITLDTELELIGHIMTNTHLSISPEGQEFAQRRKKDVEIRLHAWKRLIDAINPDWDPNEEIWSPNAVGAFMGLPSGISPDSVGDPNLRAEYEAALEKNRQDIERYSNQNRLHKWLKKYPDRAEKYIVQLYSAEPYDNEELKQLLKKYNIDEETTTRITKTVNTNIEKENETKKMIEEMRAQQKKSTD